VLGASGQMGKRASQNNQRCSKFGTLNKPLAAAGITSHD
jgi:hypothetical protein